MFSPAYQGMLASYPLTVRLGWSQYTPVPSVIVMLLISAHYIHYNIIPFWLHHYIISLSFLSTPLYSTMFLSLTGSNLSQSKATTNHFLSKTSWSSWHRRDGHLGTELATATDLLTSTRNRTWKVVKWSMGIRLVRSGMNLTSSLIVQSSLG